MNDPKTADGKQGALVRRLGLLGLVATGACSMVGAAINVIPFTIYRSVPDLGPNVLFAYGLALVPAILAAFAYAILSSGMPRAGGSYVFASRALHPYLGFISSFCHWFGLSVAVGVVSYLLIPFLRDIASALSLEETARWLDADWPRLMLALAFVWFFAIVNLLGVKTYQRALIPLMFLMLIGPLVAIPFGFSYDHADFMAAVELREGVAPVLPEETATDWAALLGASVILFSTFIGFDSIAQAGGEARNPQRTLPLAIAITLVGVAAYYLIFTAAIFHAVPWGFVSERALTQDLTAPGLLGYLVSPFWTVLIAAGAALALINDLPAMLLAVSRLMFAWAGDGIFPAAVAKIHPRWHTPYWAITLSALMASASVLGCHLAGDFFLGVDLLIHAMLLNFVLICASVVVLKWRNPVLVARITIGRTRTLQWIVGAGGSLLLGALLVIHVSRDLSSDLSSWYAHPTWLLVLVLTVASLVYLWHWGRLKAGGADLEKIFSQLPPE